MATARPNSRCARFDRFEIDLVTGELLKSGERIPLQDQPFQILRLLIEAAPEVVTREQIRASLWPSDTFVDFDLAMNTSVRKLRQALDDSVDRPKFIQTLAKRGYRFVAAVSWEDPSVKRFDSKTEGSAKSDYEQKSPGWPRIVLAGIGLALIVVAAWQIWRHRSDREPTLNAILLRACQELSPGPHSRLMVNRSRLVGTETRNGPRASCLSR
jgi:DNA-binding winged helix-turn-helix (wHTH) protein